MTLPSPIQRFLGAPDGAESPFDLLGLRPDQCDDRAIREALASRLERVARHPQGAGAEAEEVRLALHAAAAQLAEPRIRALLSERWRSEPRAPVAAPDNPRAPFTPHRTPAEIAFREAALPLLVRRRGVSRRERRILIVLAHAHGLDAHAIRRALSSPPRAHAPSRPPLPGAAPAPMRPLPLAEQLRRDLAAEGSRIKRKLTSTLFFGAIALAALVLVGLVLIVALTSGHDAAPASSEPVAAPLYAPEPPGAPEPELAPPPEPPMAPADLLAALRALPERLRTDPGDAAWRFDTLVRRLARDWTTYDGATVAASLDAIIEFMHRAPAGGESSTRALGAIASGARPLDADAASLRAAHVAPAAWSLGALARLARERELPTPVRDEVRSLLMRLAPAALAADDRPFHAGAAAGLRAVAEVAPITDDPASTGSAGLWPRWLEAAGAWARTQQQLAPGAGAPAIERDDLLLTAALRILTTGPAPATSLPARDTLERLLAALDWSAPDAPARRRLFAWFDDRAIQPHDLAVVTEWLALRSSAPGVTPDMILPRDAPSDRRRAVRDSYARAWGLAPGARDLALRSTPEARAARNAWLHAARERLALPPATGALDPLEHAVLFARLSAAASRLWRDDHESSALTTSDLAAPLVRARRDLPSRRADDAPALGPPVLYDGAWAVRWLSAPAALETRLEILADLHARAGALGPADADALATAALDSPQPEVRARALTIVRAHKSEPALLHAILEALPSAPRRETTSALITDITGARLPNPADPAWPAAARAALVLRLSDALLRESDLAPADALSRALADAHHLAADPGAPDPPPPLEAEAAAERLWMRWRAELQRAELRSPNAPAADSISRRRDARLALAHDPIRRFAASQQSALEAMAAVIALERPAAAPHVVQALAQASEARAAATTLSGQIEAVERATLRLWQIRLADDLESLQ